MDNFETLAQELLVGAYDLHTHTTPSHVSRALDDFQLVQEASQAKMAGVLIKSHYETTHARAFTANRYAGGTTKAFGSIVLNWTVGGLNPFAVQNALDGGASMVWMPTMDSKHCQVGSMGSFYTRKEGITVLDENGKLKPIVYDIFDLVKAHNVPLATGHISPEESLILCREGVAHGCRMILTHPEWPKTTVPLELQCELARMGVFIEKLWLNVAEGSVTAEYMAETMRQVGFDHAFLSTDRGQSGFEHPAEGLRKFITELLRQGISPDDIKRMSQQTPKYLMNQ